MARPSDEYLRISEVVARLRAAGFSDSESTVRRMVDAGELRSYTSRGRHRRVNASSVEALIAKRRAETAVERSVERSPDSATGEGSDLAADP